MFYCKILNISIYIGILEYDFVINLDPFEFSFVQKSASWYNVWPQFAEEVL